MAPSDEDLQRARPPVLLLTGVGLTAAVGLRTLAELAPRFRILSTSVGDPARATTPRRFVEAAIEGAMALLDAAGADQGHVVGLSFGGVIAQEIAIREPGRVSSLVLGSTSAGGELCVAPEAPIRDFLRRLGDMPVEEGLWGAVPYLYAPMTRHRHAPRIGEDIARRLSDPLDSRWLRRQRAAAQNHDAGTRLGWITAPTLVIHGEEDRILPPDNGRRLAERIGGAELITLPHGAHAFPTDVPAANRELVNFLLAHSRRRRGSTVRRNGRAAPA